jgi:hypothetical protein
VHFKARIVRGPGLFVGAILKNPPMKTREDFLTADETGFTQIIYEQKLLIPSSLCHPCSSVVKKPGILGGLWG